MKIEVPYQEMPGKIEQLQKQGNFVSGIEIVEKKKCWRIEYCPKSENGNQQNDLFKQLDSVF
jgi:hypothetical protein